MSQALVLKNHLADLRDLITKGRGFMPGGATFQSIEEQETVSPPVARRVWQAKKGMKEPFMLPIKNVLLNPYNKELDEEKILDMKHGILRSGEVKPLVVTEVDKDGESGLMITDGHHRYEALKQLGRREIPVVFADEKGTHTADNLPREEVEKRKQYASYDKETDNTNEAKERERHVLKRAEAILKHPGHSEETRKTRKVTGAHRGIEPNYSITGTDRTGRRGPKYQEHLYGNARGAQGQSGYGIPTAGVGAYRT